MIKVYYSIEMYIPHEPSWRLLAIRSQNNMTKMLIHNVYSIMTMNDER